MSDTKQPQWELIAQLGDKNPLDYGGYFIYRDKTGVYEAEGEWLEVSEDEENPSWVIYRFILGRCIVKGVYLLPFKYGPSGPHPIGDYDEWFNNGLESVASCIGTTVDELRDYLCSADPVRRAWAYREIGLYHGFENLDVVYPLIFTDRKKVEKRYSTERS